MKTNYRFFSLIQPQKFFLTQHKVVILYPLTKISKTKIYYGRKKLNLLADFPTVSAQQWMMDKITADLKGADFNKKARLENK